MATRTSIFSKTILTHHHHNLQNPHLPQQFPITTKPHFAFTKPHKTHIPFSSKNNNNNKRRRRGKKEGNFTSNDDAVNEVVDDLASELATEAAKLRTQLAQTEEAIKKSKELLFVELCGHVRMEKEELKRKWKVMEQDEKWVFVKGFVDDWGVSFHPLSVKSVVDLVDEYLLVDDKKSNLSCSGGDSFSGPVFFPSLKRLMGFSHD